MITSKIGWREVIYGAPKFFLMKMGRRPFTVHLEVTKNCGLRCNFCDYWKTGREMRLEDYAAIVKKLDPLTLVITGGEPMIRTDLPDIIRRIKAELKFIYISMITSGYRLTVENGLALWNAGLDHFSISLDFLGEEHDRNRGRAGLFAHIAEVAPRLVAAGVDNLVFNSVIMEDNLDHLAPLVRQAKAWGAKVGFSTYNARKNGNVAHRVSPPNLERLERVIEELLRLKRDLRNITNSDYYLKKIPEYFRSTTGLPGCSAGRKLIQVTPDGLLKRCADKEVLGHWTEFSPGAVKPTECTDCWYACRGETEAPLGIRRILELNS
ncbi:MAG TPA: radical SAM protein [Methylomirabilota bacterium]|nr:radical SAM protein [Methylomirabilota bacterium]